MAKFDYDIIIAGGGGAGLTAAYRLGSAGYSVLIVEKEDQVGGRTKSGMSGNAYPYNVGTQFLVGDIGPLADLRRELGIGGRFTAVSPLGVYMNGRLSESRSNAEMLVKLPISFAAKFSLAFHMLKLQAQANKFYKPNWIAQNTAKLRALDKQFYSEMLRKVHPEALPFFTFLASDLCSNRPEDISSIGGVASTIALAHGDCFVGDEGNDSLHKVLLARSGADIVTGAEIQLIKSHSDHAELAFTQNGTRKAVTARFIVSALPAYAVQKTIPDLPQSKKAALDKVLYGPSVTGIFVTSEEGNARWRKLPMMVSFDTEFGLLVNQSFPFYGKGTGRPGSVVSALAFTNKAKALLDLDENEIREIYKRDILKIFPEMEPVLKDIIIQKWTHGLPGFRPGAYEETSLRKEPHGRIYFAGDYTAEVNASLRVAVTSAEECAARILNELHQN